MTRADRSARAPSRTRGALTAVACTPLPGLAAALSGRGGEALVLCGLGVSSLALGMMLAPEVGCTCPLVAGVSAYAMLGVVGIVLALRRSRLPSLSTRRRAALALLSVLLPIATLWFARATWVDYYFVPSSSMAPSLRAGDFILVDRRARIGIGDVVVFRGPRGRRLVKRVAGVPGDRVEVRHGELWRNGEPAGAWLDGAPSDPLRGRYFTRTGGRGHRVLFERPYLLRPSAPERVVPRGHVFVLGDNRDHSDDSRMYGVVPESALIGRAFATGPRDTEAGLDWASAGSQL